MEHCMCLTVPLLKRSLVFCVLRTAPCFDAMTRFFSVSIWIMLCCEHVLHLRGGQHKEIESWSFFATFSDGDGSGIPTTFADPRQQLILAALKTPPIFGLNPQTGVIFNRFSTLRLKTIMMFNKLPVFFDTCLSDWWAIPYEFWEQFRRNVSGNTQCFDDILTLNVPREKCSKKRTLSF